MTLSVYLAAPYSARDVVASYANELRIIGYRTVARWLTGEHEAAEGEPPTAEQRHTWAMDDLADIDKADILIAFTADTVRQPLDAIVGSLFGTSGGRHVELGYAIARTKRVLLVGRPENVFHHLEPITRVDSWHQAVTTLASWLVEHERKQPRRAPEEAARA